MVKTDYLTNKELKALETLDINKFPLTTITTTVKQSLNSNYSQSEIKPARQQSRQAIRQEEEKKKS